MSYKGTANEVRLCADNTRNCQGTTSHNGIKIHCGRDLKVAFTTNNKSWKDSSVHDRRQERSSILSSVLFLLVVAGLLDLVELRHLSGPLLVRTQSAHSYVTVHW
jgi:hypothetical protein